MCRAIEKLRFEYTPYTGNWLPLIPVVFAHTTKRLPPIKALVDTGATHSLLPLELASELGIEVDLNDRIESQIAGGSRCFVYASRAHEDGGSYWLTWWTLYDYMRI